LPSTRHYLRNCQRCVLLSVSACSCILIYLLVASLTPSFIRQSVKAFRISSCCSSDRRRCSRDWRSISTPCSSKSRLSRSFLIASINRSTESEVSPRVCSLFAASTCSAASNSRATTPCTFSPDALTARTPFAFASGFDRFHPRRCKHRALRAKCAQGATQPCFSANSLLLNLCWHRGCGRDV